ncbi:unnamed protein product [Musa hybrid cultivar]
MASLKKRHLKMRMIEKILNLRMKDVEYVQMSSLIEGFWTVATIGSVLHVLTTGLPSQIAAQFAKMSFSLSHVFQCMTPLAVSELRITHFPGFVLWLYAVCGLEVDWSVQGKNNTLSFPSYYIDEDAVACLDGDGCKVRSGLTTADDGLNFDTSIACDSCDIWYHAFCVGFSPEYTSVSSWLCPRCLSIEEPQKMDDIPVQDQGWHSILKAADHGWAVDHSFLGKVSVSVADDGETALVVSMVQRDQTSKDDTSASEDLIETNMRKETETSFSESNVDNPKLNVQVDKSGDFKLNCDDLICSNDSVFDGMVADTDSSYENLLDTSPAMTREDNELNNISSALTLLESAPSNIVDSQLSLSHGGPISSSDQPLIHSLLEANHTEETMCNSSRYNDHDDSFSLSCSSYQNIDELRQDKLGELVDVDVKDPLVMSRSLHNPEQCRISVDDIITSSVEDVVNAICQEDFKVTGLVEEHTTESNLHLMDVDSIIKQKGKRKLEFQVKAMTEDNAKKSKSDETSLMLPSGSQADASIPDDFKSYPKAATICEDDDTKCNAEDSALHTDIMSIVREADNKHDGQIGEKHKNNVVGKKDDSTGLRVKKIMRSVGDKAEKEILVQKLGKEIKEAVQVKTSNCNFEDNAFHGKLLTAFREAIVKPRDEVANKFIPSLRMRKQLLQKGKVRENLTKKIYATSSGRRRRAWDRDWEIEFWKYRCPKLKPEKIETLQSVLELLKKASTSCMENPEMDQGPQGDMSNSILSRVYLADASVFPRKDDIKPLSAAAVIGNDQKEKSLVTTLSEKDSQNVASNKTKSQASDSQGMNFGASIIPKKAPCKRGSPDVQNTATSSILAASKVKGQNKTETSVSIKSGQILKEQANVSNMAKNDKRKWAMEILARKNALTSSNSVNDGQEEGNMLKGNYPLLAQLPSDMRPVVAPSRHNKVPISVRQAQLYRIAEHYLRRTNLSVICRTADVELAVADAVNVEKDISERSNSKMVYINLCAQVLSQCTRLQSDAGPSDSLVNTKSSADQAVEKSENCIDRVAKKAISEPKPVVFGDVEEALRVAGLSDSPPNSPEKNVKGTNADVDSSVYGGQEYVDNDIDIHPLFGTYGDTKNKLEDQGYAASSSVAKASEVSENENSKMKGMFSIIGSEEPLKCPNYESQEPASWTKSFAATNQDDLIVEVPSNCSTLLQYQNVCGKGNAHVNVEVDVSTATKIFQGDEINVLSSTEHNKLHGPEKEPPLDTSSELMGEACKIMEREAAGKNSINNEKEDNSSKDEFAVPKLEIGNCSKSNILGDKVPFEGRSSGRRNSPNSIMSEIAPKVEQAKPSTTDSSDSSHPIYKKVEAYVKEHIRPLCKSGVITVEQYRWAVTRTTDKVMGHHCNAKNANFLIKEGDKVKKLAEQYAEVAQQKM